MRFHQQPTLCYTRPPPDEPDAASVASTVVKRGGADAAPIFNSIVAISTERERPVARSGNPLHGLLGQ